MGAVEILRECRVPVHTSHSQSCPLGSDCDINLSKEEMKYQSLLQPQRTVSPARTAVHRSIPPTARTGVSGLISRYTTLEGLDLHYITEKIKWFISSSIFCMQLIFGPQRSKFIKWYSSDCIFGGQSMMMPWFSWT